ncbi:MAG: hypothetical protein ACJ72E_13180 [Marmoricola sp.]
MNEWSLRAKRPVLVHPIRVGDAGGPTKARAAGPFWRRVGPGLYVPAITDRTVPEQRIVEEAARLPTGCAVTGWAALRLLGAGYFDGLGPTGRDLPVPLVVPPPRSVRRTAGPAVHRDRLEPGDVRTVDGVASTGAERAAFDAARRAPHLRAAVVVLDMALASGVMHRARLDSYLASVRGWAGVEQVRRALLLADERSMSPKETELRLIWTLDARLPAPRCNWPVADADHRFIGRPDLLSVELGVVGEFDGAGHRTRSQHREDLRRDDRFRSVGLEPFRVVGADLADAALVLARIRSAISRAATSTTPRTWLLDAHPRPV